MQVLACYRTVRGLRAGSQHAARGSNVPRHKTALARLRHQAALSRPLAATRECLLGCTLSHPWPPQPSCAEHSCSPFCAPPHPARNSCLTELRRPGHDACFCCVMAATAQADGQAHAVLHAPEALRWRHSLTPCASRAQARSDLQRRLRCKASAEQHTPRCHQRWHHKPPRPPHARRHSRPRLNTRSACCRFQRRLQVLGLPPLRRCVRASLVASRDVVGHGGDVLVVLVHEGADDVLDGHDAQQLVFVVHGHVADVLLLHHRHRLHARANRLTTPE